MKTFWTPEPDDDEDPVMALWRLETEAQRWSKVSRASGLMPWRALEAVTVPLTVEL